MMLPVCTDIESTPVAFDAHRDHRMILIALLLVSGLERSQEPTIWASGAIRPSLHSSFVAIGRRRLFDVYALAIFFLPLAHW